MKMLLAAAGALALVSTAASADPVTRRTVTGYSASAAVQDGVPVERPDPAAAPSDQATATAVAGPVAQGPDGTPTPSPTGRPTRTAAPWGCSA